MKTHNIVGLILLCFLCIQIGKVSVSPEVKIVREKILYNPEISDSNLLTALYFNEVIYPQIVVAQSRLETANYTSPVSKQYNNIFGLYDSNNNDYYHFNHWTESVEAYKNMVQYKYKGGSYYTFLENLPYAMDTNYTKKLRQF